MSRYLDYLAAVHTYRLANPEQRDGQAHFNVLWNTDRTTARAAQDSRGVDAFYDDEALVPFLRWIQNRWGNRDN